jgi:hypothetical protein
MSQRKFKPWFSLASSPAHVNSLRRQISDVWYDSIAYTRAADETGDLTAPYLAYKDDFEIKREH